MANIEQIKQKLHDALSGSNQTATVMTDNTFSTKLMPSKNSFKMPLQLTVGFDDETRSQLMVKLDNDTKTYGFTLNKKQTTDFVKFIKSPKKLNESAIPDMKISEEDKEYAMELEDKLREMQDDFASFIADVEDHPAVYKRIIKSLERVYDAYEGAIEQTLDLQ